MEERRALVFTDLVDSTEWAQRFGDQRAAALWAEHDERARELYWEGHRRTDLIRYNLLTTGTYLWPWKGGVASGTAVDPKYNIFPIPATNLTSNTNLTQNEGY